MINKQVRVSLEYNLLNLHHVVVQASYVENDKILALQLLNGQTDTAVFEAPNTQKDAIFNSEPVLFLKGATKPYLAGGHTQTLTYSGQNNQYFVGTKPKKYGSIYWDTQIARVAILQQLTASYQTNTQLPRLSYMNRAGSGASKVVPYLGKDLERLEIAVSPNFKYFLVASIDFSHVGHFALYNLADINNALNTVQKDHNDCNIQDVPCLEAFNIPNFNIDPLRSIQGYGIDNDANIYVSSQPSPNKNWLGFTKQRKPREIVKIPWGEVDTSKWFVADLDKNLTVNELGYVTEFEGMQIINKNSLYLTVAYHRISDLKTMKNKIFKVVGL